MLHQWHTREPRDAYASAPPPPRKLPLVRFRDASPAERDQLLDLAAQSPWPNGASFSDACQRYYEQYGVPPDNSWSRMEVWIRVASLSEIVSLKPPADAGGDLRDTPDCKGNRSSFWRSGIQNVSLGSNGDPSHNWGVIRVKGYERWACCGQPADHPGCWKGRVKYQMDLYDLAPGFSSGAFWGLVDEGNWDGLRDLWLQEPQRGSMWLHWNQYEEWHQTIIRGKQSLADGIVDKFQKKMELNALDQATLKMILDLQNRWNAAMCGGGGDSYVLFPPAGILRPPPAPAAPKVLFTTPIPDTWDEEIAQVIQVAQQFTDSIATNQFTAYLSALQQMNQLEKDANPFIQAFPRIQSRFVFSPKGNAEFRDCVNETLREESAFDCPTIDFFPRYQEMRNWVNQLMNPPQVIQPDPKYDEIFFWKDFNPEFLGEYYVAKTVNDVNWLDEINQESKRKLQEYDPQPLFAKFEALYADMDNVTEELKQSRNNILPAIRALYTQRGYMTKLRRVELETIYNNLEVEHAKQFDETKDALVNEIAETKSLIHADFARIDEMMTQFKFIKDAKAIRDELKRISDTYPLLTDYESFKGVSDVKYPTKDQLVRLRRAYADLELGKDNLRKRAGNHTDLKEIVDSIATIDPQDEADKVIEFEKLEELYEDLRPRLPKVDDFSTLKEARQEIIRAFKATYHAEFEPLDGLGLDNWGAIEAELKRIEENYPTKAEYSLDGYPTKAQLADFFRLQDDLRIRSDGRDELDIIIETMTFANRDGKFLEFEELDRKIRNDALNSIPELPTEPFCFSKPDLNVDMDLPWLDFKNAITDKILLANQFITNCIAFERLEKEAQKLLIADDTNDQVLLASFRASKSIDEAEAKFAEIKEVHDLRQRLDVLEETGDTSVLTEDLDSYKTTEGETPESLVPKFASFAETDEDTVEVMQENYLAKKQEAEILVSGLLASYDEQIPPLIEARTLLQTSEFTLETFNRIEELTRSIAINYPLKIWKDKVEERVKKSGNLSKEIEFEILSPNMTTDELKSFESWVDSPIWYVKPENDLNDLVAKFRDEALKFDGTLKQFGEFLRANSDMVLQQDDCGLLFRATVDALNGKKLIDAEKHDFGPLTECMMEFKGLWRASTRAGAEEWVGKKENEAINPEFYKFMQIVLKSTKCEKKLDEYLREIHRERIQVKDLEPDDELYKCAEYGYGKLTTDPDELQRLLNGDELLPEQRKTLIDLLRRRDAIIEEGEEEETDVLRRQEEEEEALQATTVPSSETEEEEETEVLRRQEEEEEALQATTVPSPETEEEEETDILRRQEEEEEALQATTVPSPETEEEEETDILRRQED